MLWVDPHFLTQLCLSSCWFFVVVVCFSFLATSHSMGGSQIPSQGLNLHPLHWNHGILTTGPPGKSLEVKFLLGFFEIQSGIHRNLTIFDLKKWSEKPNTNNSIISNVTDSSKSHTCPHYGLVGVSVMKSVCLFHLMLCKWIGSYSLLFTLLYPNHNYIRAPTTHQLHSFGQIISFWK